MRDISISYLDKDQISAFGIEISDLITDISI